MEDGREDRRNPGLSILLFIPLELRAGKEELMGPRQNLELRAGEYPVTLHDLHLSVW